MTLDDAGDDARRVWEGDVESFAAVVLDGLSSGTNVDMPCQGLLSTSFFRWQANQPAVGSTTKRQPYQKIIDHFVHGLSSQCTHEHILMKHKI